jgi:Sigma-70 region 2
VATCEAELIESAAHGDQEAFRQLWDAHHAAAMAAACRLCHQHALAEEITQGAFLLAWRGLPRFQAGSPFRPWLQNLRHRLGSRPDGGRRRRLHWQLPRRGSRAIVPSSIRDAFDRITHEARIPSSLSMLHCSLKPHVHEPVVRSSWPGRRKIRLLLPLHAVTTMGQAELDVLLATGLARSLGARKPAYTLGRLLLAGMVLIACTGLILFWMHHLPLVGLAFAMALCASAAWFLHVQARSIAFHADTLSVRWLGRERVCSGLHALADGSRTPRRRRWGEPSLVERIERVCGTRVEVRDNQLTLVG